MRPVLMALCALFVLSACGADGAPQAPAGKSPGITITGEARAGVVYGGGG